MLMLLEKYTPMCIKCTCIKVPSTKYPTCWPQHSALASAELVLKEQKIKHGPAGHSYTTNSY